MTANDAHGDQESGEALANLVAVLAIHHCLAIHRSKGHHILHKMRINW